MKWVFLGVAIVAEVAATMSLRAAVSGAKAGYVPVVLGYVLAFSMMSFALQAGMGIGVAYGIWAATGVAITATLSKWIFDEPLTAVMAAGIVLIAAGVLLVELGAAR